MPVVAALGSRSDGTFLVRYQDADGPHVRFRTRASAVAVRDALREVVGCDIVDVAAPIEALPADANEGARPASNLRAVRTVPYEPEVGRYGGLSGVAIAEDVFVDSTRACLALLRINADAAGTLRSSLTLAAMTATVRGFAPTRDAAAGFAEALRDGFVARATQEGGPTKARILDECEAAYQARRSACAAVVGGAWADADLPPPWRAILGPFQQRMAVHHDRLSAAWRAGALQSTSGPFPTWERCLRALLPSYLHMTNNRLGVTPTEERYIAHAVARSLRGD
jgi:thiopeptide-type bacteriocin biosynthesis protein